MNAKFEKTLERVFKNPVLANIKWRDIEIMLISLGAEVKEGNGSRVRVRLNGVITTFHRPHPRPDTNKGAVQSVRKFLIDAGIK